jgi:hypothetical protein
MHPRICMHEYFDLINSPFKCKCETYQIFIIPFQKIVMNTKWNSQIMDLTFQSE